jgi:hypothetical protein
MNGSCLANERISIFSTIISISPVFKLGFLSFLSLTFPTTFKIDSFEKFFILFLITNCVIPHLSLKSTKINFPIFLLLATNP